MTQTRPAPARRPGKTPAERFRYEIEAAVAEGVKAEDMRLHLTLGDASKLRRDNAVAVTDISFTGGVMRYLGVPHRAGRRHREHAHAPGRLHEVVRGPRATPARPTSSSAASRPATGC
ncbi:hypothetical protein [Phenylobacterium sp. J367]|uniref:hypothetical protein n=1 Tax=Phenylobacterium sp. J367 TaxID=2898435 RepID=UPI0021511B0B|nr:hypothetical protein [Phenylobacterium sp. J367]MCR5880618.1 hypothetical protein [Phenylobacterium sp. J367]